MAGKGTSSKDPVGLSGAAEGFEDFAQQQARLERDSALMEVMVAAISVRRAERVLNEAIAQALARGITQEEINAAIQGGTTS